MLMALRSLAENVEDILGGADVAVLVVDDFLPVNEREMVEDDFFFNRIQWKFKSTS